MIPSGRPRKQNFTSVCMHSVNHKHSRLQEQTNITQQQLLTHRRTFEGTHWRRVDGAIEDLGEIEAEVAFGLRGAKRQVELHIHVG